MALSGNLQDFSIPDVFRLISLSGKTGVLHLFSERGEGSVWFREGQVFFAQSDRRRGLLGERLVTADRITQEQLAAAVQVREGEPEDGRRIGQILVDQGAITLEVLVDFVQEQIQDTVFDLFLWDEGSFTFEALDAAPEDQDIGLAVSIENIVMEGARRLAEWKNMRTAEAAAGVVFRVGTVSGEHVVDIALKPSEWRVVTLADGTRTVTQIAEAAGVPVPDASRTLYGLFGAGLLQMVDQPGEAGAVAAAVPVPAPIPAPAPQPIPEPEPAVVAQAPVTSAPEAIADTEQDELAAELEAVIAAAAAPTEAAAVADDIDEGTDSEAERPSIDLELGDNTPPSDLILEIGDSEERLSALREPEEANRIIWAGIGNEVAALTGADPKPVRSGTARSGAESRPSSTRRIRWDASISRDDVVQIHAAIKAL